MVHRTSQCPVQIFSLQGAPGSMICFMVIKPVEGSIIFSTSQYLFQECLKQCIFHAGTKAFFLATVLEEGCNMDAERIKTTWTTQKINDMLTLGVDEHKEAAAGSMPDAK